MEAAYLGAGIRSIVYTLAPERIVVGGGVAGMAGLLTELRSALDSLARCPGLPEHGKPDFISPAELGPSAGALGALVLAETALARSAK